MRTLYTVLHYLAVPFILLRLAWRGVANPAYFSRWRERFGYVEPVPSAGGTLWIHAVSVGEVQAALPFVRALRARHAGAEIVLTTTTPTGMQRVRQALGDEVVHRYMPYDLPGAVSRFLVRTRPRVAIIFETEIWPNLVHLCAAASIPVIYANARLSARSAAGYGRLGRFIRDVLGRVTAVAAQSREDAARLEELGADPSRILVTGSVKFDVRLPASLNEAAQVVRRTWGVDRSVWIAASTHEGEDEQILDAFRDVRREVPDSLLVLVPRHPERFTKTAALSRRRGFRVALRSEAPESCADADVFIGDTMGELPVFYGAADVAFVGGSLVDIGGHNMLEPAALGLPVVLGPYLHNFADISRQLLECGAAVRVADSAELGRVVVRFLRDANLRHGTGERGQRFVAENRGALDRLIGLVERYIGAPPEPPVLPERAGG